MQSRTFAAKILLRFSVSHRREEHWDGDYANALGSREVYVVDPRHSLPDDWQELRERGSISKTSVSASKWTFVKRFNSTDECFDYLEGKNFRSIVTSPHVKGKTSIFLHEGDYTLNSKLALWFGSEAVGISERAVERSDMCISIPMFGMIESLNLGTSSGIVLYEVTKQRREYQSKYRKRDKRGNRESRCPLSCCQTTGGSCIRARLFCNRPNILMLWSIYKAICRYFRTNSMIGRIVGFLVLTAALALPVFGIGVRSVWDQRHGRPLPSVLASGDFPVRFMALSVYKIFISP